MRFGKSRPAAGTAVARAYFIGNGAGWCGRRRVNSVVSWWFAFRRPGTVLPVFRRSAIGLAVVVLLGAGAPPAAADTVTSVNECPGGDYSETVSGKPASVSAPPAPEGFLIGSYCVAAGRGNGNTTYELHELSEPVPATTIRDSSGDPVQYYSLTYVPAPEPREPTRAPSPAPRPTREPTRAPAPEPTTAQPAPESPAAGSPAAGAAPSPSASAKESPTAAPEKKGPRNSPSPSPSATGSAPAVAAGASEDASDDDTPHWGLVLRNVLIGAGVLGGLLFGWFRRRRARQQAPAAGGGDGTVVQPLYAGPASGAASAYLQGAWTGHDPSTVPPLQAPPPAR